MSAAVGAKSDDTMMFCASCGTAESDDIKLKKCTACYLVKYCSVKCQKEHRSKHKKECKKRAAELYDEILFKQPESNHFGDCPICCLPLSADKRNSILSSCCCKQICRGCDYANKKREIEGKLEEKCAFCRKASPDTDEDCIEQLMKRIEANDPVAICHMGTIRRGEGDYKTALDYWSRSAALGNVEAHYQLSNLYHEGKGVEKDEKRELHHLKEAAIGGHPEARDNLAILEGRNGQHNRAVKHFIIAANLGFDQSLQNLKFLYKHGRLSKEDFTAALRGYQAAIAAEKSPQREEARLSPMY